MQTCERPPEILTINEYLRLPTYTGEFLSVDRAGKSPSIEDLCNLAYCRTSQKNTFAYVQPDEIDAFSITPLKVADIFRRYQGEVIKQKSRHFHLYFMREIKQNVFCIGLLDDETVLVKEKKKFHSHHDYNKYLFENSFYISAVFDLNQDSCKIYITTNHHDQTWNEPQSIWYLLEEIFYINYNHFQTKVLRYFIEDFKKL